MEDKNNEIDLIELSRNLMVRVYHFIARRILLLGIFLAIGIIIGFIFSLKKNNQFQGKIIATSYVIPAHNLVNIINAFNDINGSDKALTCKLLNMSAEEMSYFQGISADTAETIRGSDQSLFTTIQINITYLHGFNQDKFSKGLICYVDSNEYVNKELQSEKESNILMINKIKEEIKNLDSLQNNILLSAKQNSRLSGNSLVIWNDKVNNFFQTDIMELEAKKKSELKRKVRINNGLYIISQNPGIKVAEISSTSLMIKYGGIFLMLGFTFSLILEFIRQVKHIESKKE